VIDKFLEGVSSKLADRAVIALFSPAFVFLAVGVGAWVYAHGGGAGWHQLQLRFQRAGAATLIVLVVATLLLLLACGVIVQRLTLPALRLLEGYWPRWLGRLKARRVKRHQDRYRIDDEEFQGLADRREEGCLGPEDNDRYVILEERLARFPSDPSRMLPTRLGNVLRSAEGRPGEKYGLDAPKVWTQLVLVLPAPTKAELEGARAQLDQAVAALIWSVLVACWTIWAWWALPLAILSSGAVYRWWLLEGAAGYGQVIEAAFDVNRFLLYAALHLPLPANPKQELTAGKQLTKYLARGSDRDEPAFQHLTAPPGS
jgi:hypothetical protein